MAQTDIETVETLPIRICSTQQQAKFTELVDTLHSLNSDINANSNERGNKSHREECQQALDLLVYDLYELTPEEVALVEGRTTLV